MSLSIACVLPTKNEEASIGALLGELRVLGQSRGWDLIVVVVDDSTDRTAEIARGFGAQVISGGGRGLGFAMMLGLKKALGLRTDWILSLDTDGQADTAEIPLFVETAERENADVVLASRFMRTTTVDYEYPQVNWIGNRILVFLLRLATGFPFTDSHGGLRLMRPQAVRDLFLLGRHTYVQETLIQMHRRGFRLVEVPSRWRVRQYGESRVIRSIPLYAIRTGPALLYYLKFHFVAAIAALAFVALIYLQGGRPVWMLWGGLALSSLLAVFIGSLPLRAVRVSDGPGT